MSIQSYIDAQFEMVFNRMHGKFIVDSDVLLHVNTDFKKNILGLNNIIRMTIKFLL